MTPQTAFYALIDDRTVFGPRASAVYITENRRWWRRTRYELNVDFYFGEGYIFTFPTRADAELHLMEAKNALMR